VATATSNRRLLLFLAIAVLTPVVLVAGPFHSVFFPKDPAALRALARVDELEPPLATAQRWLDEARLDATVRDAILRELVDHRCADAALLLERVPVDHATSGVRLLFGIETLLSQRPAVALSGLEDATRASDADLAAEARYALAQALLLLGRRDDARRELERVSSSDGPRRAAASLQLAAVDALGSRR
jgi:hypothetical protein